MSGIPLHLNCTGWTIRSILIFTLEDPQVSPIFYFIPTNFTEDWNSFVLVVAILRPLKINIYINNSISTSTTLSMLCISVRFLLCLTNNRKSRKSTQVVHEFETELSECIQRYKYMCHRIIAPKSESYTHNCLKSFITFQHLAPVIQRFHPFTATTCRTRNGGIAISDNGFSWEIDPKGNVPR
jgi:hypothetical protein